MKAVAANQSAWKSDALVIAALMIAGGVLRILDFPENYYADELWLIHSASAPFDHFVKEMFDDWVHPPLYFFILRGMDAVVGLEWWTARALNIFTGIISIPVIYIIGKKIAGQRAGIVAAALLSLSPMHIWHSDYGRHYALLVLMCLLSTLIFVEVMRNPQQRSRLWSLVAINVLLAHTHYFGWLLIAAEGVAILLLTALPFRNVAILFGTTVAAYLPWLSAVWTALPRPEAGRDAMGGVAWINPVSLEQVGRTIVEFNGALPFNFAGPAGLLLFTPLAFLPLLAIKRKDANWRLVAFLALSICLPFIVVYVASVVWRPIWLFRVMMVSLPAYYLLIAIGATSFPAHRILRGLPVVAVAWMTLNAVFHLDRVRRIPFEEAAGYIAEVADIGTPVILQNFYLMNPIAHYYRGRGPLYQIGDIHMSIAPETAKLDSYKDIAGLVAGAETVVVATYYKQPVVREQLARGFAVISERIFPGKSEDGLRRPRNITVTVHMRRER